MPRIVVDAAHLDQMREHGGLPQVRDENALEAALALPGQKWNHEPASDLATLAATYTFGLVRAHAFNDGNKRIAFLTGMIFLGLSGKDLDATEGRWCKSWWRSPRVRSRKRSWPRGCASG